jgi:hypothetical protein
MDSVTLSRRSLLQAIAATMAAAAIPFGWAEIAQAAQEVHVHAQGGGDAKISLLSAAEAADIEAVASQIIPTDDSPGAREARSVLHRPGTRDVSIQARRRAHRAVRQAGRDLAHHATLGDARRSG